MPEWQPLSFTGEGSILEVVIHVLVALGGGSAMKRFVAVVLFSASLFAPLIGFAEEHRLRFYDRDRRDWHEWNEQENRAYRHWLMEERRERRYREYRRLRAERQREYWRWRHEHPDWR